MSDTITYGIYQPRLKDIGNIVALHNSVFKTQQTQAYYTSLYKEYDYPFWIAIDESDNEILGFVATKIKYPSSELYISTLAEAKDITGVLPELLKTIKEDAKKKGIKTIKTHVRKTSKKNRDALTSAGFEETSEGVFKDGETKYNYTLELKGGKKRLIAPLKYGKDALKGRKNQKPMPKPKKGEYQTREAKASDISQVLALHNQYLGKKREYSYFKNKIDKKHGIFIVATDSNGQIAGYIVCRPEKPKGYTGQPTKLNFVSMAVGKKYRGWGIATQLLTEMIAEAKEDPSIEYIYGHVRGKNKAAINIYKRFGFNIKPIGKYKDSGEIKYQLKKRLRMPSLKPYWNKYQVPLKWFAFGLITHELIHGIRNYE